MDFKDLSHSQKLGDEDIESKYRDQMVAVAQGLDRFFNGKAGGPGRKVGFVLLTFEFGDKGGRCNYISNGADRHDVVKLMQEQIKRFTLDNMKNSDA